MGSEMCIRDRSDGFLWTTTPFCCCNARSSSSNSSRTSCCNTRCRCCCNTRCCNTFYRAKITPAVQAVIFWRRLPTLQQQQSSPACDSTCLTLPIGLWSTVAAAVIIPGSTSTHMKVNVAATFGQKIFPCLGLLHEVAPAVPSAGRTRAKTSCCLRRRDGKDRRLYTHNGNNALIRPLRKA